MPHRDPQAGREYRQKYYGARLAAGLCRTCGKRPFRQWRTTCEQCGRESADKNKVLRAEAMAAYGGPVCACCGEQRPAFLTIDHIEPARYYSRRQKGEKVDGGNNLLRRLRKQKWPAGYQVLCYNCNYGRSIYGECPHKTRGLMRGDGEGV